MSKQLGTSLGPRPKTNPSADHFQYHSSGSNLDRMRSRDETSLGQANENLDGYYMVIITWLSILHENTECWSEVATDPGSFCM